MTNPVERFRPRILFVAIGSRLRASSRFRVHSWIPHLEREGYNCQVIEYFPYTSSWPFLGRTLAPFGRWLRNRIGALNAEAALLRSAADADVIIVQEALLSRRCIRALNALGKPILFDFSDPIHMTNRNDLLGRLLYTAVQRPRFENMMRVSKAIIVENERLIELASDYGIGSFAIQGPIDTNVFQPVARELNNELVIGWTGSPSTYGYLRPIFPVLSEIGAKFDNVSLTLVGAPPNAAVPNIRTRVVPWNVHTEPAVVSTFDIAISYQPDNEWTRARGGGKLFVYMAAGVPCVTSHSGIGEQVISEGVNGLVARDVTEWREKLERLITNDDLRKKLGTRAREVAVQEYSYEAYLPRLITIINEACKPVAQPA